MIRTPFVHRQRAGWDVGTIGYESAAWLLMGQSVEENSVLVVGVTAGWRSPGNVCTGHGVLALVATWRRA